jgi:putative transposase
LFQEKALEMGLTIKAMEIMPDHVHISLTAPPSLEPQYVVNQLKGYTSKGYDVVLSSPA